jgi:YD repeat-containing protein
MLEYDAHAQLARIRIQPRSDNHYYRVYDHDYDAAGRVTREHVGGTETTYTYNARGDVAEERHLTGGVLESRTTYRYEYR